MWHNHIAAAWQPWLGTPAVASHEHRPAGARAERGGRSVKVAHLRGTERTAAPLIAPIAPVFGAVAHAGQWFMDMARMVQVHSLPSVAWSKSQWL